LKEDPLTVALRENDRPFVAGIVDEDGDRRQRDERQAIRRRATQLCFESQRFRGAEQVLPSDDVAGGKTELMRQIHRVGGDVVQPRDKAQRIQRQAG